MQYKETKKMLNQLTADLSQMSAIIHQTHWYMRGRGFLSLHPLMDKYRESIEIQLDKVAERLITLDGSPYSTLQEFADNTKLQEQPGEWDVSMEDRLANLVDKYRYLADTFEKGIEIARKEGDAVTEDMFIEFKKKTEKRIWMIQAELGNAPQNNA